MNIATLNESNIVTNVIVSDKLLPNSVELTSGGIGWSYDPVTKRFTPPAKTEAEILQEKIDQFESQINAGYKASDELILPLTEFDRNQYTQLLSLLKEGIELSMLTNEATIDIKDINGRLHDMKVADFRKLMFSYGIYFKSLWDAFNALN